MPLSVMFAGKNIWNGDSSRENDR